MLDASTLTLSFLRRHPQAAAEALEELPLESAAAFLLDVPVKLAAPVVAVMLPRFAGLCLMEAGEPYMLSLLPLMPASASAAILRRLPVSFTEKLLKDLAPRTAFNLRLLLRYPATSVGAWMEPNVPVLPEGIKAGAARERLLQDGYMLDRYVYIVSREQLLLGRIATHELLQAEERMSVDRMLSEVPETLLARGDLETVLQKSCWSETDSVPVLSRDHRFLGLARFYTLHHASVSEQDAGEESIFTDTLMELMEAYWSGLSRLIESPFPLSSANKPAEQAANNKE